VRKRDKDLGSKDKVLTEDAAIAVVDVVVDQIAILFPSIKIAYGLSKALYGSGLKLRQQKALEWVEMVRDNPSFFTEKVINDAAFQDGFVVALEKYIIERNENKRKVFRNIFLGFAIAEKKELFPLEKCTHTLSQLSEVDIEVLRDTKNDQKNKNYQVYGNNSNRKESSHNLINLGLLFDTTGSRGGYDPGNSPFVVISPFGLEFKKYIVKN
jgi:hypothetical protein